MIKRIITSTALVLCTAFAMFAQSAGTTFTSGGLKYKITSVTNKEVSVTGPDGTPSGTLTIPKTVSYSNGDSYKLTGIESSAFTTSNMASVKSLFINMQDIPANVFKNFTFMTLTIGSDVVTIGSNSFNNSNIYKTIWLCNDVPSGSPLCAKGKINYCSSTNYEGSSVFSSYYASSFHKYATLRSKFVVNGVTYVYYNTDCDVIDCDYSASNISVNIGSTVTYQNQTFNVRNINNYACYRDDRITGNIMLANNGYVGLSAFESCSNATGSITVSSQGDIKDNAFKNCSKVAGTITVTNSGNIGNNAFAYCSKATAGNIQNQGYIGQQAFISCSALKTLQVNNSGYIGAKAFNSCTGLETLEVSNGGEIKREAFKGCAIANSATINNNGHIQGQAFASVTGSFAATINNNGNLADSAFYQSQMKSLTINSTVKNLGKRCFHKSTINNFATIANSGDVDQYAFSNISGGFNADIRVTGALPAYCFSSSTMNNVTIGNGVISLGNYCFSSSTMNNVTIGSAVKSLGNYCFSGAKGFTTITLPDNVITLGTYCFQNCTTMQNITLSRGLTEIPEGTFSGCSSLLRLDIWKEINNIGNYSFNNCSNLKDLIFENKDNNYTYTLGYGGTSSSKTSLFKTCGLDSVYVGGKLSYDTNSPSYSPFMGNTSLRAILFADDREDKISAHEFENCTKLQNVWMNNVMSSIGDYAFSGCTSLKRFNVGPAVNSLGSYSFKGCSVLTDINLSNVVTINNNSFQSCSSLPQISIPQSTTSIGNQTFLSCTSLKRLFIEDRPANSSLSLGINQANANYNGVTGAGKPLFSDCPLDSVYIGGPISYDKSLASGYSPFFFNESLRSVYITNQEKYVYEYEFHRCSGLTTVKLGNGVRYIKEYAFQNCSGLTYFEFASTLQSIGAEAFSDCDNLTTLISHNPTPPVVGNQGLDDINKFNCTLYVPEGSISEYQEADQWRDFFNMYEIIPMSGIAIQPANLLLNAVGETATLAVVVTPENAMNSSVTWTSSNPAVATVSNTGVVTAVANGTAVITATTADGTNLTATCNVTINIIPPIDFADANVKAICVANWDTNGDGELSEAEAAAVTDLGEVFKNDTTITSFNELQYFTGLTEISANAFYSCKYLKTVIIPENVTVIGSSAFLYCLRLSSITIPEGVTTIGSRAFMACPGLISIHIPASVTLIDFLAFGWDSGLMNYTDNGFPSVRESITVAEGNTVYDSRGNCNAIIETATNTLMYGCSNTIIPSSVTAIAQYSFNNSVITSIVIPQSVTAISGFIHCKSLTSVTVENPTPITINRNAFTGSYDATLYVPAGSKAAYEAADFWKNFSEIVEMEDSSPAIAFADANVKALCVANWDTNGDGELSEAEAAIVTDLGEVFRGNTTITSFNELQHFTGLTSLLDNAFNGCTNLISFIIPRNVTSIGGDTFRDCKNLISISVADGNTNYDSRDNCNAIIETATNKLLLGCTNTNIPMGVTSIGVRAFQWCSFTSIDIPNSVTTIEEDAFSWCPNLTSFIIPEGVTTIAPITFYQCTNLTTITIPSSLKNVKTGAFRDCSSLSKVIVPDIAAWCGIIYEGDDWNGDFPLGRAHHLYSDENTEITEVVIPEGVTRIEARVFRDAEYVTSVTLPNSLTYIDQEAFRGMRHLTSINIPSSVTVIGKSAFTDCDILQKVIVPDIAAWCQTFFGDGWGNPLYSSHHIFSDETTEIKDLIIPEGVTKISHFAFFGCRGLTSVTIPNSITQLNKSTFCYCSGLKSVTLPSSITSIGDYVFAYCSSLTDVWCYAEDVPTTGSNAFNNSPIATATLHVPIASLESYKATSPWSGFGTIVPIEEAGIEVTDISQLDNAIYIEPFSTRSGKTVNMDIRLKNNQDIAAYSFNLVLPEGVTLAKNTKDKYIYTLAEGRHDGHSCTINEQNGNSYSIAVLSISGGELSGNDGTVITLQVIMDESMEEGDYPIQIMNVMYSLPNGQTINVPETRTALTIENILVGDVNDNKTIDIGDAVCIVNYIVGKPNAVFVEKAADVNGNGTAGEIGDAVSVVNIIVGKTIMQMPKAIRTNILDPQ